MTPDVLTDTAMLRRADGLMSAAVGDELLMMDTAQGKYFNLNSVGSRIWELLAAPTTVEALVGTLVAEYEVDDATARQETQRFLAELRQRGLLAVGNAAD